MAFPIDRDSMVAAGYRYDNNGKCKGCGADMEWWVTPKGGKMPFDLMQQGDSKSSPHHATCPNADDFRSRNISSKK